MFDFLFKKEKEIIPEIQINEIYPKLKELYSFDEIPEDRKKHFQELMDKYGYLPYPQIRVLEEVSPAETLFCLETKWKNEKVFDGEHFLGVKTSPLARNNIKNADWIKKEGHDIKLINLAALGDGNKSDDTGKFIDWLKQLLILPVGNREKDIFSTTIYLTPFHPRNFGCAYLPASTSVSKKIEDANIKEKLNLDVKQQVQTFITLSQLAGHPVIYDILPQTGRFAKIILANPYIVRWFDLKEFSKKIDNCVELISNELERKFDKEDVEIVKNIYKQGGNGDLSEDYQKIYDEFDKELLKLKKANSEDMLKRENQIKIQKHVKEVIARVLGEKPTKQLQESDITKQEEVIKELIKEELWTAPGGAWCSSGVPVFDKMSECKTYPIFKHYDYKGNDVTEFANLDCQSPFYFVFLENGQYNKPVVDFFINFRKKLQATYNFDGFRYDHVDHVVDELSVKKGVPISYRIPSKVLRDLNIVMKENVPYFATLAEYMLGGNYLKEYHEDMEFDILWGNDIPAQAEKNPQRIVDDNQVLSSYNSKDFKNGKLSVLKTYNNQDGEFGQIDQYPAKLGKDGALFKWFSYKFLPGGKFAQRPILYVDGDESFTQTGIERTISNEVSMKRERDFDFFAKFDAINRFAKSQELVVQGEAQIIAQEDDGFVSWMISKEPLKSSLLIVANYKPLIEKLYLDDEIGKHIEIIENETTLENRINLPSDYKAVSEYVFDWTDFVEKPLDEPKTELYFEELKPSEFRIFLLKK